MFHRSLFICICIAFAKCENEGRKAKIFSFDANKDDLQVGLDFSIPFIKIPIKTAESANPFAAHDYLGFPKIHVNLSSLIVGGLVFLVTTFISPILNKPYSTHHRSSRHNIEYNPLIKFSQQLLEKNSKCLERFSCLSGKQKHDIQYVRTAKRIMRNELLSSMLNTTALEDAANYGLRGYNCLEYQPCAVTEEDFNNITQNLIFIQRPKNT